jgi:hypothetical protein
MLNIFSFVVAIIGVVGLLFSLRQAYRVRLRQFEEKYVERYWSILDSLSLAALSISDQTTTTRRPYASTSSFAKTNCRCGRMATSQMRPITSGPTAYWTS